MTVRGQETRERVRNAISTQRRPTVTVLSSLLAAQDDLGYLPDEAIEEIALFTSTTTNDVWGVASFYPNFRFTPPGEHVLEVCWGPTCHLAGASRVLKAVLDDLGLVGEGDTEDRKVTFRYNTCLGACTQAPVISMDHRLIGRVTPDSAAELTAGLRDAGR